MKNRWWDRGPALPLILAVLFACGDRQDDFDCDNAVLHLRGCCPRFNASAVDCRSSDACGPVYPALSAAQSQCIRSESCETIRATGLCDRAQSAAAGDTICPYAPPQEATATAQDAAAPSVSIECTNASDCPSGDVCCVHSSSGSVLSAVVACWSSTCPLLSIQLCAHSSECGPGRICAGLPPTLSSSSGLLVCGPPLDASSDMSSAEADGGSDAPVGDALSLADALDLSDGTDAEPAIDSSSLGEASVAEASLSDVGDADSEAVVAPDTGSP